MADNFRWRYGDTSPAMFQVASATVIEIGDLLYRDPSTQEVKPAADLTYDSTLAATQETFHDRFVGVAMEKSRNGDTDDIRVATRGVFEFDLAAATFKHGDYFGPDDNATPDALLNQQVVNVATPNLAIGQAVTRKTTKQTKILIDVRGVIIGGGCQAPA